MLRRRLPLLLLALCLACATPHDLMRAPGVQVEQVCDYLDRAGYDPGGCYSVTDTEQLSAAISAFQEHQQLPSADGEMDAATWLRLKTVVEARQAKQQRALSPPPGEPPALSKEKAAPPRPPAPEPPPVVTAVPQVEAAPPKPVPQAEAQVEPKRAAPGKPAGKAGRKKAEPAASRPLAPGERVLAAERGKCLPRFGAWLLAYEGKVRSLGPGQVRVVLRRRLSYRYNPGEKGVNRQDWFCVPRRRHCYSAVPFGDWGGTHHPGELVAFPPGKVIRLSRDPKDALRALARRFCR